MTAVDDIGTVDLAIGAFAAFGSVLDEVASTVTDVVVAEEVVAVNAAVTAALWDVVAMLTDEVGDCDAGEVGAGTLFI